jgi:hypothetical protein
MALFHDLCNSRLFFLKIYVFKARCTSACRILFSKMLTRTGVKSAASGQLRCSLVLRFLAGCHESEMFLFVEMAFKIYAKLIKGMLYMTHSLKNSWSSNLQTLLRVEVKLFQWNVMDLLTAFSLSIKLNALGFWKVMPLQRYLMQVVWAWSGTCPNLFVVPWALVCLGGMAG